MYGSEESTGILGRGEPSISGIRGSVMPGLNLLHDPRLVLLLSYFTALLVHLVLFPFSALWIAGALSVTSGMVWAVFIPGLALLRLIFPHENHSWGMTILAGLALEISIIHVSYLMNLYTHVFVHPLGLMVVLNSALVFISVGTRNDLGALNPFHAKDLVAKHRKTALILVVGITARFIVAAMGTESLAPDACLYSNYAMNLLEGNFATEVLRDPRIYDLGNGIQYSFHQGFVYLASLSFILVQPGISGPVPILILTGLALAGLVYELGTNLFSETAGSIAAAIILTHPTFVFHSAVAYGPEITSFLAILGCLVILTRAEPLQIRHYLMAGFFFAIGDLIWYPNYLLFATALPFFLYFVKKLNKKELLLLTLLLWTVLASRVFFVYIDVYLISALATLGVATTAWFMQNKTRGYGIFAIAILVTETIWRGAVQMHSSAAGYLFQPTLFASLAQAPNPQLAVFLKEITPSLIMKFLPFLTLQLTPIVLSGAVLSLSVARTWRNGAGCLIVLFVGIIGTLFLFANLSAFKDVLAVEYILSDSRFFLSLATMAIIPGSSILARYGILFASQNEGKSIRISSVGMSKKQGVLLLLLTTCYVPIYASVPNGISLINHEDRFGWVGLPQIVLNETDPDSIILTQQATEMAWLTRRKSVYPSFSTGASLASSLNALRVLLQTRNASYFVMDGYTAAKYRTLDEILKIPMYPGDSVPIDFRNIGDIENSTTLTSILLEAQTEPNINGDYARLFGLGSFVYSHVSDVNLLSAGWAASKEGLIENSSGMASIVIGEDANYTNTWRPVGYDLGLEGQSGFILMDMKSYGASLARVEFYGDTGTYYGSASSLGGGKHFFYIGSSTIGDIRFVIEGEHGDSILVESIEVWGR